MGGNISGVAVSIQNSKTRKQVPFDRRQGRKQLNCKLIAQLCKRGKVKEGRGMTCPSVIQSQSSLLASPLCPPSSSFIKASPTLYCSPGVTRGLGTTTMALCPFFAGGSVVAGDAESFPCTPNCPRGSAPSSSATLLED